MASSYSAVFAVHKTLGSGADTVTLSGGPEWIEVFNRTGTADIYVTVGQAVTSASDLASGTGDNTQAPVTPTVGANDTYVIPAAITSRKIPVPPNSGPNVVVEVVSSTTQAYSVVGLPSE